MWIDDVHDHVASLPAEYEEVRVVAFPDTSLPVRYAQGPRLLFSVTELGHEVFARHLFFQRGRLPLVQPVPQVSLGILIEVVLPARRLDRQRPVEGEATR